MGSWKTMATSPPRISRSCAGLSSSRSIPSSRIEPDTCALAGSSPSTESAVTDLPQPDSPTSATTSPRLTVRLTPRTASTGPVRSNSPTWRFSTSSTSGMSVQRRIEEVAESVTQEVETQGRQEDRQSGQDRQPRVIEKVILSVRQHGSPGCSRRPLAQAQKRQQCGTENRTRNGQRGLHENRSDHIGQEMAEQNDPISHAGHDRRLDIVLLPESHRLSPGYPNESGQRGDPQCDNDVRQGRAEDS